MIRTTIKRYQQPDGQIQVAAWFVGEDADAGKEFYKEFLFAPTTTPDEVDAKLRQYRDSQNAPTNLLKLLPEGERDIDASIPVVEPPTAEEIAHEQFRTDKVRLAEMDEEIKLSVRKADNPAYVALKAKVEKAVDDGHADVAADAEVTP